MQPISQWSNKTKIIIGATASALLLGVGTYWYLDRINYFIKDNPTALLEKGIILTKSGEIKLALSALEQSCELKNSDACYEASKIYGTTAGFTNPKKQSELFIKSLKLGNQTAFIAETDRVFNYLDMPDAQKDANFTSPFINSVNSNDLFFDQKIKEAFDVNNSNYKAGVIYYRLFLETKPEDRLKISDFTKLTPVMDEACEKNIMSGCAVAADIKTKIFHIEGGVDGKITFFEANSHKKRFEQAYQACSNGLVKSCLLLSIDAINILPRIQTLFAYKENCNGNKNAVYCSYIARMYDVNIKIENEKNTDVAKDYYTKACKLDSNRCDELQNFKHYINGSYEEVAPAADAAASYEEPAAPVAY
jgi:tetratricopeptide (TPR) repeat protein